MTHVLDLQETTGRKALSSRETARSIEPVINELLARDGSLIVDLDKMVVVTPSFFDEFMHVARENAPPTADALVIDLTNTSDHQFTRFRSVCKAHEMSAEKIGTDHWRISNKR